MTCEITLTIYSITLCRLVSTTCMVWHVTTDEKWAELGLVWKVNRMRTSYTTNASQSDPSQTTEASETQTTGNSRASIRYPKHPSIWFNPELVVWCKRVSVCDFTTQLNRNPYVSRTGWLGSLTGRVTRSNPVHFRLCLWVTRNNCRLDDWLSLLKYSRPRS